MPLPTIFEACARFWQMLENASQGVPGLMPMTAAVAPEFARRYPEAEIKQRAGRLVP